MLNMLSTLAVELRSLNAYLRNFLPQLFPSQPHAPEGSPALSIPSSPCTFLCSRDGANQGDPSTWPLFSSVLHTQVRELDARVGLRLHFRYVDDSIIFSRTLQV